MGSLNKKWIHIAIGILLNFYQSNIDISKEYAYNIIKNRNVLLHHL